MSEKDMDAGRLMAKNEKLRDKAKKIADKEKRKVGEILEDALSVYEAYSTFKDILKNDDVAKGMVFYRTMLIDALKTIGEINNIYASTYARLILDLMAIAPQPPMEPQAQAQMPSQAREAMAMLNTLMTTMLMNMLQTLTGMKMPQIQTPQPSTPPQQVVVE